MFFSVFFLRFDPPFVVTLLGGLRREDRMWGTALPFLQRGIEKGLFVANYKAGIVVFVSPCVRTCYHGGLVAKRVAETSEIDKNDAAEYEVHRFYPTVTTVSKMGKFRSPFILVSYRHSRNRIQGAVKKEKILGRRANTNFFG